MDDLMQKRRNSIAMSILHWAIDMIAINDIQIYNLIYIEIWNADPLSECQSSSVHPTNITI